MTPKSLVYMVVAVFVGYMLVSAVPGQVAMYTAPSLSVEKGDTITLTGSGFSPDNESSSSEIDEVSEFSEESDAIFDVESIAADAVGEAEQAAEAANAARNARSGLEFMGTMVWLSVDVLVALVVYWFAKRRFA